jgi:hypothetical protein
MNQSNENNNQTQQLTMSALEALGRMKEIYRNDIDAGRVDEMLVSDIRAATEEITENKRLLGATSLSDTIFNKSILYSTDNFEFLKVAIELSDLLDEDVEKSSLDRVGSLLSSASLVGNLFPRALEKPARSAFGESVTSILYTLLALKRGDELPHTLELSGGDEVELTQFTFDHALEVVDRMKSSVSDLYRVVGDSGYEFMGIKIEELESGESFGIYRLTDKDGQQVLRKIRAKKSSDYDAAFEFGGKDGVEPSLGFVIDESSKEISQFKADHKSPFSIRIDNEGDTLALDIGSVLSEPGTLDKEAADLIAIGDSIRSGEISKNCTLHHNSRPFKGTGLEKPETFEEISSLPLEYLNRVAKK